MKVLVTGASGRIGRAVWIALARQGHAPVGLDRVPSSTAAFVGELDDPPLLARALDGGVDGIVHVAALHAPQVGHASDAEFRRIDVDATRQLARVAAAHGVRRFVFTSTTALYGDGAEGAAAWFDEASTPRPRTVYHRSKLAAEALLHDEAARAGFALSVLRVSRCFPEPAPRMALYRLHRGVDARDVAEAHRLALEREGAAPATWVISGATPFVRGDAPALWHDAAGVVARRAPALAAAFARRGWPLPARIDRVHDASAAQRELGWRPRRGFDEVLRQLDDESPEVLPP